MQLLQVVLFARASHCRKDYVCVCVCVYEIVLVPIYLMSSFVAARADVGGAFHCFLYAFLILWGGFCVGRAPQRDPLWLLLTGT